MATDSAQLLVKTQFALGMTQKELGDVVGRTKRTIQRWQKRGCMLGVGEAKALAKALGPVQPALAKQVLALGVRPAPPPLPAKAEVVGAILRAAAGAAKGTAPQAVQAAVTAAFAEASEQGVDVPAVLAGLEARK